VPQPPTRPRPVFRSPVAARAAATVSALTAAVCLAAMPGTASAGSARGLPATGVFTASAGQIVDVADSKALKAALAAAVPGQTIRLADGTYTGNFKIAAAGTAAAPITVTGSPHAVLTTSSGGGNVIQLTGAPYWTIRGLTLTGAQKGIMIDASDHVVVDSVEVRNTTMEGIHFRTSSSYGVVRNSYVHDTGTSGNGMGEGIYVGTANTLGDTSDHVLITGNVIGPRIGGENIDIKEGTTGGVISGNTFDGSGLTGANYDDSWVDIKGNGYTVTGNRGSRTTNDGFQTHSQYPGWGCGTVFRGNASDLTGATGPDRYAVHVTNYDPASCPVTVTADNTVTGGNGLVNPGVPVG
jgi:nitrous oxidase accessory protein NosD